MRSGLLSRSVLFGAVTFALSALFVTGVIGSAVASPSAAADRTWTDPAGDANGAPDLTGLVGTNDATGNLTMRFTVSLVPDSFLFLHLDTNFNMTFKDEADRVIAVVKTEDGSLVSMTYGFDAAGTFTQKPIASLRVAADASSVTISLATSELAIGDMFNFWAETVTGAMIDQNVDGDFMPDGDLVWVYALEKAAPPPPTTTTPAPAVVKPVIGAPVATPLKAVAGKRLTVVFPVTRSDNGAPLTTGTMVCDPSVTGKIIPHAESFKAGKARLSFLIPKTAKGKLLRVKVTIKTGSHSATRIATFRVA